MGRGISQLSETKPLLQHPSRFFADIAGDLVDLIPRRSAFLQGRSGGALESELGWTIISAATSVANRRKKVEQARAEASG